MRRVSVDYYNKLMERVKARGRKRNIQDLVSVFIIGMIIMIAANFFLSASKSSAGSAGAASSAAASSAGESETYQQRVKSELEETLCKIDGAGKVEVMIYFGSGGELIPAYSENNSTRVTEETDGDGGKRVTNENTSTTTVVTVTESGGSKPLITKQLNPDITGIIVIAEGGGDPAVKYRLYEAVKTVFNIQQYRVNIYPMQKSK